MTDIEIMLAKANHTEEEHYKQEVNGQMESAHPCGDEVAILRKTLYALIHGLPIPDEFETYNQRAEEIKAEVRSRLHPTN